MKKLISMLLCFVLIFSAFCFPAEAAARTAEEQFNILYNNMKLWNKTSLAEDYYYAVTDLDGNGRLEIIAAVTQGTGIFTYANFYEVNSSFSGVEELVNPRAEEEGYNYPELIVDTVDKYTDRYGLNHYLFRDDSRNGYQEAYTGYTEIFVGSGMAQTFDITGQYTQWSNGGATENTTYYDSNGNETNKAYFDSAVQNWFAGMKKSTVKLGWFALDNPDLKSQLRDSYVAFSASATPAASAQIYPDIYINTAQAVAPTPTLPPIAAPAAPAAAIPVGSNGNITITKNPTSESLAIGGKTWFIAHATNADTHTWQLIDTNNRVYTMSEAMAANPGLKLADVGGDTLELSNVPMSMNGWSAQAVFSNEEYKAATTPATIYVGDFVSAYGSVIDKYRRAYNSGLEITAGVAGTYDISEMAGYSDHVGYAMKDLDKDGTPELIIAATGTGNHSENIIYEIDTLINGLPQRLCLSRARDRYYLRTDSTVLNEASGGAAYSYNYILRFKNGVLSQQEALRSDIDEKNVAVWFLTQYGQEKQISEGEAHSLIKGYESAIYLPYFTQIV